MWGPLFFILWLLIVLARNKFVKNSLFTRRVGGLAGDVTSVVGRASLIAKDALFCSFFRGLRGALAGRAGKEALGGSFVREYK